MDNQDNAGIRYALRQAALRNRKRLRTEAVTPEGLIVPHAQVSPEHYHLVYNVPRDELSVPDFSTVYVESKEAYQKMFELGQEAEPNVEWYEDGKVGLEMRLKGRADLWWIILEVAACIKSQCLKKTEREIQKRRLVLVPEER